MPIGDPYATLEQLKARLRITDTTDDAQLTDALEVASREVERFCRRQFHDAGTTSPRVYVPERPRLVITDDFHTTVGLQVRVDLDLDGTYETVLADGDVQPEPLNGVVDGVPGWPYWRLRLRPTATRSLLRAHGGLATVEVTARWGWAAVPDAVHEAVLILAEDLFKLRDTPFGVGGFGELGRIRARENPHVAVLLGRYRREGVLVA